MTGNTRYTVALHIITWMARALQLDIMITSDRIALSVNTNPVFIRRILGLLLKAKLVSVQRGTNAGWTLARPPEQISLLDIYQAVEQEPLFEFHHTLPSQDCPVGRGIQPALTHFYGEAEMALKQQLARSTIADLLAQTLAQNT